MLILLVIIGFIIGGFIIAMGGGGATFYLGILTGLVNIAPASATATSLFTALPSLCIGAYSHYRTGNMRFHFGNRMLITAVPATVVGSLISGYLSDTVYRWLLFLLFICLGSQILWQSFGPHRNRQRQHSNDSKLGQAFLFGALSGLMVGIAGLSGGSPLVAGMLLMGLSMQEAAATSSYVLIVTSLVGIMLHSTSGAIAWAPGIALMIGAICGAAFMPYWLNKFNASQVTSVLRPIMGTVMIIMAITTIL
ncbi:sulfite exporter TauE/SafE family protein [Nicoliella spurrieriana]|uniref:Probable membrane transporter protein n=1 Tax=Nicoliella spurrieriana TaxID=2925830 RepID=A0A976X5Y5_9LACO|nr:sulfite exporter TauE/SafE family protein [Nicoliella spurrieriana]UQS87493.1 sulfite exporter TauE/SafE family protein [Nicoliella spurrieriana]